MIGERQRAFAEPALVRALIERLLDWQALPAPVTGTYEIQWPALYRESETVIAEANLKRAQAAAALTPLGGDPLQLVEIDDESNVWLVQHGPTLAPLEPEGSPRELPSPDS